MTSEEKACLDLRNYESAKGLTLMRMFTNLFHLDLKGKRILEIGCSTGALMELLDNAGADAYGIDVDSSYSGCYYYKGNKRRLYDLQEGVHELRSDLGTYDFVIAQEVIEHIPRPYEFLESVHSLLKPGGYLFLTTPNLSGITAPLRGEKWCGVATPGHVLLFNARSLNFLLKNSAFDVVAAHTNLVPLLYQSRSPLLFFFNSIFRRTSIGGGLIALYKRS
jgi:2-polyprenyl-3-methyl-5-hydroxy-6-metoxy-1,4-benzoquinol methylase